MSRRDDIESLAYAAMYLVRGFLPWNSLRNTEKQKMHFETLYKKKNLNVKKWCAQLPPVFYEFIQYARTMRFDECPRYDAWI